MTEQNDRNTAASSVIRRTIRKVLLIAAAMPALLMGAVAALPYLLDDPSLAPDDAEQSRTMLIIGVSVVATVIVHLLTKSWRHSNGN